MTLRFPAFQLLAVFALACAGPDAGDPRPEGLEAGRARLGLLAAPPIVGRPTAGSVTLGLVAGDAPVDVELRLEPPGEYSVRATLSTAAVSDLVVEGLRPGTEYSYTLRARAGDSEEVFPGRFVTRREPGSSFTFALFADPHLPVPAPEWLDSASAELFAFEIDAFLTARLDAGDVMRQVMAQIRRREPDFIVCLGDMLTFYRGFNDPFPSREIAERGYLDLRRHLGRATAEAAFFAVVGNWDGESGWQPERLRRHAREARMRYLLNPGAATYPEGGGPDEDYFAWTWGDALLVVANVVGYTPTKHTLEPADDGTASDWTLGAAQRAWLEATLAASDERFKLLFLHHPVGGAGGDALNSAYGRGGGRAAGVGEQAFVHRLMLEHGVQVLFYGHDHVFTDMVVDGVHYTLPGSAGAPWKFTSVETGYVDFDERSGFALVHVEPAGLRVEMVDLAGRVFRSYSVAAETGTS